MYDKLRQIGIPTTIATTISLLVVVAPLLFQIDERYVKAEDHEKVVRELEQKNEQLMRELAKLSGFQEAMVNFIQEGRIPRQPVAQPVFPSRGFIPPTVERVEPSAEGSTPPIEPLGDKPKNWSELKDGLARQQRRLVP